jgi:hypothetical protein
VLAAIVPHESSIDGRVRTVARGESVLLGAPRPRRCAPGAGGPADIADIPAALTKTRPALTVFTGNLVEYAYRRR